MPTQHHLDPRADEIAAILSPGDPDQHFTTPELSKLLGISTDWLTNGRSQGYGPPFVRLSPRAVRYRRSDIVGWLESRTYRNTTEARHAD